MSAKNISLLSTLSLLPNIINTADYSDNLTFINLILCHYPYTLKVKEGKPWLRFNCFSPGNDVQSLS